MQQAGFGDGESDPLIRKYGWKERNQIPSLSLQRGHNNADILIYIQLLYQTTDSENCKKVKMIA